jgi:pimeloyl-ACP methyl ester carboxylesterase
LVVLLHGFPEFWFGWRLQIAPLAAAGFRVVAPDTRGYNLSSRPDGVAAYSADKLADDIRGLIRERGAGVRAFGGSRLGRNHRLDHGDEPSGGGRPSGHPRRGPSADAPEGLPHPGQLRRSWYFFYFALPGLPEHMCAPDASVLPALPARRPPAYTPQEMDRYVEAWSQPGAARR